MVALVGAGAAITFLVWLVRRIFGTSRVTNDDIEPNNRVRLLIEGTRQKPW